MVSLRRAAATVLPVMAICAAVGLFSAAFLIGSPRDEEELRFALLSAWLRVRALAAGDYLLWTPELGLGVSQPFVPNFGLHPLLPLLGVVSAATWVRVVLSAHLVAGAAGVWYLGRRLSLSPAIRAVCVITHVFAAPGQNYVLSDFWLSHFIVWTMAPWILLLAWRLLDDDSRQRWPIAIVLGLVTGFTAASTNPGHAAVYAALAIAVLIARGNAVQRLWAPLALALVIAGALVLPNIVQLASEGRFFEGDLSNLPDPLALTDASAALKRPFGTWEGTRTLFIGAPWTALALAGCVWFARTRTDLVLGATIAGILLFTTAVPVPFVSARYQFRDPLTICAILLGGLAAERLWSRRSGRALVIPILAAQVYVVTMAAWPLVSDAMGVEGRRATALRGATADTPLVERLRSDMPEPGRLLYSPRVDYSVAERQFVDDGIGINALAYRGVPVVNGLFKGVSTDTIWPNDRLFYGRIKTPTSLVESDSALDVLGIRYVLAFEGERVAPGLRVVSSYTTIRHAHLVLLANDDAGPGAVLMSFERAGQPLAGMPDCGNERLFCRDLGALGADRVPGKVSVVRSANAIEVTWPAVAGPTVLVLVDMYRDAWTVDSDKGPLRTRPIQGALLGVDVPPGVSELHARYRPGRMIGASFVCYAAIAMALVGLMLTVRRRSARPSATAGTS
jgi:hypothetical protein